jgi:predicted nucleic acid-binding protein
MERYGHGLPFTPWHRLEVRNAIRLALFHGLIDAAQAKEQLKQLDTDLKEEALLTHTAIDWTDVLREAEKLGAAHNESIGCRSADLFHVAAARQTRCDTFLTFDEKQAAMAAAANMTVKP